MTAILHVDDKTLHGDPFIARADLLDVVIYFLLGLVMFSQTHFALLRTTWAWYRVPTSAGMTRNWTLFSLVFLAIVSIIAFILPTRYSMGFLSTLNYIVSLLGSVFYFLFFIITLPILALLNLLMSLFFKKELQGQPVKPPVLPDITPNAQPAGGMTWLDLLKSVLFWVVLIGVVGYAFYQYFRQNQELLDRLKGIPIFSWIFRALRSLWNLLRRVNQRLSVAVQNSLKRLRPKEVGGIGKSQRGFLSLRRLSPRQRIQFFYLALVRRGGEHGLPRQVSQTPYEYAQVLESQVAEVNEDLDAMTGAFLEARYSKHEITTQRAGLVQRYWDRIKRALRRKRDGGKISH